MPEPTQELTTEIVDTLRLGFAAAIETMNDELEGTIYAVQAHCHSGITAVGLTANTLEHVAQQRANATGTPAESPYWEVHCAEFAYTAWEPFGDATAALDRFYEAYYDGEVELPDGNSPTAYLGSLVVDAFRQVGVDARVRTTHQEPLLLGIGFSDPYGDDTVRLILDASAALNTPPWHAKVTTVFGASDD